MNSGKMDSDEEWFFDSVTKYENIDFCNEFIGLLKHIWHNFKKYEIFIICHNEKQIKSWQK